MRWQKVVVFAAATLICLTTLSVESHADKSPYEWAMTRLDFSRDEKVDELNHFCKRIDKLAATIASDEKISAFFNINHQYALAQKKAPAPQSVAEKIEAMRDNFDAYYIKNYFAFYDMLFISNDGHVFYTLRKEDDLDQNLLQGKYKDTLLGKQLAKKPEALSFVNFHDYDPSSEAAAFFLVPISKDGIRTGYLALQLNINKINTLFTSGHELGQTGEVFLVNRDGYMLTESNFEGKTSILKRHLADKNINAKFQAVSGHRTVTDYRNKTALSAFQVFKYHDIEWLVVAKIDKDEITTEHYLAHSRYYAEKIQAHFADMKSVNIKTNHEHEAGKTVLRVDMDEFLVADNGQQLETFGISTCTGVLAAYAGKFGYLAHISSRDKLYGQSQTDLLLQMTRNIKKFRIYPYQQQDLIFVIIAPHLETISQAVESIVEQGFLLSQIRFAYVPDANSARVIYDYAENDLSVIWNMKDSNTKTHQHLHQTHNIGQFIESLIEDGDKTD